MALQQTYDPSYTALENGPDPVFAYQQVRFVFSAQAASRLYAVRRIAPDFDMEAWSIGEFEAR